MEHLLTPQSSFSFDLLLPLLPHFNNQILSPPDVSRPTPLTDLRLRTRNGSVDSDKQLGSVGLQQ